MKSSSLETKNCIGLEKDEMATACTEACVNHEVDGGCGEVRGARFSWGLGGKTAMKVDGRGVCNIVSVRVTQELS